MLQIDCPHCGKRPENEFHCGGQSHIQRPALDCSDEEWGDYMFNRDNPKGDSAERWRHSFGCGRWFNMVRSTVTHEIKAIYRMTDPRPEIKA
ncbi:sarcosine oxidase subunit delta [Roseateles violae]|uniref:Sarcosine oxidase subunit delta n=1 Tax=Roseateles violae TaxID=3058042 RepID=A0ABT8DV06_9BURK|nr:sarcosine oxidase subunit delta [Pelomonas sp. PFR6]MDN3922151.1 sarcosine oxidase subunit delta [Pelomonas sp. PFR6]